MEVAASSAAHHLHDKPDSYRAAGVREYVVWRTGAGELDYFVLRGDGYERLPPDGGVHRGEAFPGLWLDPAALLRRDLAAVLARLNEGLATPDHAAFAARLAAAGG